MLNENDLSKNTGTYSIGEAARVSFAKLQLLFVRRESWNVRCNVFTLTTDDSRILKPGQQAVVILSGVEGHDSQLTTNTSIDLEKIMAWKNNEFIFEEDDLPSIMRQLARWYDIQVTGAANDTTRYTGRITKNVPISQVLAMFEKLGYVKFEIKGKQVLVKK